ncbi:hypothetical protein NDU88_001830 [Pleurodeles waltl]|uniref:Uncharacterized protein n=1 Tax=Pleurodeles waltl TaxID=8319 RepID=A0AAV7VAS9_PLEWA|nr:hypothetical protein NDU88_001830 [Pleurodeles waltl]
MAEERVRKALALLEQAGCKDLVRLEALGPLCPARRVSAGVAATVMACSLSHADKTASQVRRGGRLRGGPGKKGAAWAAGGVRMVGPAWAGLRGNPRPAERTLGKPGALGGAMENEPGAACTARPDGGRGGGNGQRGRRGDGVSGVPDEVEGAGVEGGSSEGVGKEAFFQPGTSNLGWQEVLDFDDAEPGEQNAAREPWWEEKAGPGAACRIASAGVRGGRRKAVDASAGRCGGKGFAPAGAATRGSSVRAHQTEQEFWREEGSEGSSVEEGELVECSDEQEWWECGKGGGVANHVIQSLQNGKQLQVRTAGLGRDGSRLEKQTAQEQPALLSPGKELTSSMVSVVTEAREDAVRLLKGVYVQDVGVATESGKEKTDRGRT